MQSLLVGVAGVVGALGTLLVQNPKHVGQKLGELAALALQKLRKACRSGQPKGRVAGPREGKA
jgi:hypothetical protein